MQHENQTTMQQLSYSLAPHDWAICFQHDCPLANSCLRHAVALLAPAHLTHHVTVLPAAREGDHCSLFATSEPIRIARGMKHLILRTYSEKVTAIRHGLYDIFGSKSSYYRYRDGDYDITPEQQARIAALFRKHGAAVEPQYDHTALTYYFPKA